MVNRAAEKINHSICDSLKKTGNRGIILSGWGGIKSPSSEDLLYLESAPHDWLFPRCHMVIHHGGAGTTAAGLRAGLPNIVIPFTADQPFRGRRVHAIGAGPKPIFIKNLSVENLTRTITEAGSGALRRHAQVIGQQIRNEDGISESVKRIEKYFDNFHSSILGFVNG
jgi:sterol 3beta-glucosyltransferase